MKKSLKNIVFQADGVIVNVNRCIKNIKRSFNGINVNGYIIDVPESFKQKDFNDVEMYESALYSKTQFTNIYNKIKEDDIKIKSLVGNNGIISEKEFESLQ